MGTHSQEMQTLASYQQDQYPPFYHFMKAFLLFNKRQRQAIIDKANGPMIQAIAQLVHQWARDDLYEQLCF